MAETVSALIAVHNGEQYLAASIESMLAQSVPPDEVIVVDDGSTDRSGAIAESFGPPVTVLRQENRGQAAALAVALSRATGSCLAFNDADDLWTPRKQQWQLAALADRSELGAVFGFTEQFVSPELGPDEQHRLMPRITRMPGRILQTALVRRWVFERVGPIDPALRGAGITDWIARMTAAGIANAMLTDIVHRRRLHPGNYGRTSVAERDKNLLAVLQRQIRRARNSPTSI